MVALSILRIFYFVILKNLLDCNKNCVDPVFFGWFDFYSLFLESPVVGAANGETEDQPIDDGSKGELVIGPGAGGMQPRPSEVKRALPPLTYQQEEMLKKAKRYAMEQSVQQASCYEYMLF